MGAMELYRYIHRPPWRAPWTPMKLLLRNVSSLPTGPAPARWSFHDMPCAAKCLIRLGFSDATDAAIAAEGSLAFVQVQYRAC